METTTKTDNQEVELQVAEEDLDLPINTVSEMLGTSLSALDATQKNALHIQELVNHVEALSGHEQYVQAANAIMNDPTLSTQEKLQLKRQNDEWQDQRIAKGVGVVKDLQDTNTQNTADATNAWAGATCTLGITGLVYFFGFTPQGRKITDSIWNAARRITA